MKLTPHTKIVHLSSKLRELARENTYKQQPQWNKRFVDSLNPSAAFIFSKTPEGSQFWRDVVDGEEIPDHWWEKEIENYQIY